MQRSLNLPIINLRFHDRLQGRRERKGPHKPTTRSHLGYAQVRGFLGRPTDKFLLVNTGKDYSPKPAPRPLDGTAYANQRDIRGHGKSTSRVKRVERQRMQDLLDVVHALPPKAPSFYDLIEPGIRVAQSYRL